MSETIAIALTEDRSELIIFPDRVVSRRTSGFEAGLQESLAIDFTRFGLSEFPILYIHSNKLQKRLLDCFGSGAEVSAERAGDQTTTITSKVGPEEGPVIRRWEIDNVHLRVNSYGVWHTYGMPHESQQFKQSIQYGEDDRPMFLIEEQRVIVLKAISKNEKTVLGERSTVVEFLWLPSDSLAGTEMWGIASADTPEEISELLVAPE
ncbi:hypothetical protein [Allorhodopirellula heiligendammensis]|uniref:Uncharacterized protein n=1 Tax=Allorhodopirellula heiligendammensis TaxID=2714739 RepID=A0A5C6BCN5_9BACT|nr:hypothetical protein [Allorhodopirellula heiligendammensis]TWU09985.1 hypothetical protein Poly21_53180 [Allorhodopirellula heiligendammensis]